jgi:hypothetical protein
VVNIINKNDSIALLYYNSAYAGGPRFRIYSGGDWWSVATENRVILNQTNRQLSSNFNISDNGTIGGNLVAGNTLGNNSSHVIYGAATFTGAPSADSSNCAVVLDGYSPSSPGEAALKFVPEKTGTTGLYRPPSIPIYGKVFLMWTEQEITIYTRS